MAAGSRTRTNTDFFVYRVRGLKWQVIFPMGGNRAEEGQRTGNNPLQTPQNRYKILTSLTLVPSPLTPFVL
ncbi:hypothetical protein UZ36_05060 [Candidatus Nitromaritima sp. SCGC AAA799-C22]|nr:hypothetical protein UZ36_05060 [Candidatus Nitromaritima sp. SCGC AAA799-C22]